MGNYEILIACCEKKETGLREGGERETENI